MQRHPKRARVREAPRPRPKLPDRSARKTCRALLRALRRIPVVAVEGEAAPLERLPLVVVDVQHDFLHHDLLALGRADAHRRARDLVVFLADHPAVEPPTPEPSVHERLLDALLRPLLG